MTDAVEIFAFLYSHRHNAGMLGPVVRSAVGVVRESVGLVCNVAELGVSLVLDTSKIAPNNTPAKAPSTTQGKTAPRRVDARGAANVIPFPVPAARKSTQPMMKRG